jgi:hypothetical protein
MAFRQHELREREDTERVPPARRGCRRVAAMGARASFAAGVLSLLACASAGSNDASHGDDASAGDATIGDAVAATDAARNDATPNDGAVDGPLVEGASPDGEATDAGDAASDVAPPASMDGSSEAGASCIVDVPCELGVPCHTGTTSCAGGQLPALTAVCWRRVRLAAILRAARSAMPRGRAGAATRSIYATRSA